MIIAIPRATLINANPPKDTAMIPSLDTAGAQEMQLIPNVKDVGEHVLIFGIILKVITYIKQNKPFWYIMTLQLNYITFCHES